MTTNHRKRRKQIIDKHLTKKYLSSFTSTQLYRHMNRLVKQMIKITNKLPKGGA